MSFLSGRRPEFILTTESQAGCGDPTSWPRTHLLNAAAENRLETLVTICLAPQSHRITPAEVTSRQQNNILLVHLDCSATAIKTEATCSFRNHRVAWHEELSLFEINSGQQSGGLIKDSRRVAGLLSPLQAALIVFKPAVNTNGKRSPLTISRRALSHNSSSQSVSRGESMVRIKHAG